MKEGRLDTWRAALKRERLAANSVQAAEALFKSGGPDPGMAWIAVDAARDALEAARHHERATYEKVAQFVSQGKLKFPDDSDVEAEKAAKGTKPARGNGGADTDAAKSGKGVTTAPVTH